MSFKCRCGGITYSNVLPSLNVSFDLMTSNCSRGVVKILSRANMDDTHPQVRGFGGSTQGSNPYLNWQWW